MRLRILALAIGVLTLSVGVHVPFTQTGVPIDQGLAARVAGGGSAQVIVGLQTAFTPEGELPFGGVAMQRSSLQRAMDEVTGRVAAAGIPVMRRFEFIPYFTAHVNAAQLAALAATPGVASIDEDRLSLPMLAQTIPLVGAATAHAAGFTGTGWAVAILDTGVMTSHPFMGGKVVSEACYSSNVPSQSATTVCPGGVTSSTATGSGVNCDENIGGCEHGTHVAGIAAGVVGAAGAPAGLSGVAPGANIIAIQVFSRFDDVTECGGNVGNVPCILSYTSDQIAGLSRVLALAGTNNVNRIASANMSLGGGLFDAACDTEPGNPALKAAIDNLRSIGIATAIATGNGAETGFIASPSCISSAISVGSTTKGDIMSPFTNRKAGLVALLAPGSDITSSILFDSYGISDGTSMATPHVAGAWAVLKQAAPTATVAQVLNALQTTGVPINDAASDLETPQAVYQRISVNAARLALGGGGGGGVPGAPGAPVIGGSGNAVTFTWTPPTTGGAPTSYALVARLACAGAVLVTLPVGNVATFQVNAPNGTFCVSVQASNASGAGPESPGTSFAVPIPPTPPGATTSLSASTVGQSVTLSWAAPSTGGTPTGYSATVAGPVSGVFPLGNTTTVSAGGLPGGSYSISVAATNAGGTGPSSNTATFVIGATAPTMNAPVVVGSNVTLSWVNGAGGSVPTSFIIRVRQSAAGPVILNVPVTGNSLSVPAPGGTYIVSISGVAGSLVGPESNQVTVVVP